MSASPFLNRVGSKFYLRHEHVRKLVCLPKPFSKGCLDFIAVLDVNDVIHLGLRCRVASSHLRSLQRATEENAEFEKIPLGTHEEVAGLAREHDRLVRSVNPLIAEGNGGFAQPFPSIPQIVGEFLRQSRFSGRPTVVFFTVFDPLLAVIALSTGHTSELYWRLSRKWHGPLIPDSHQLTADPLAASSRSAIST
jgi:hypothetical protein